MRAPAIFTCHIHNHPPPPSNPNPSPTPPPPHTDNYDGVWKITLLCALLQLVGIFFVRLMPRSAKHQVRLLSIGWHRLLPPHTRARDWATDYCLTSPPTHPRTHTQEEKQSFDQTLFWGGVAFVAFTVVAFFVTIGLDVSYMLQGF